MSTTSPPARPGDHWYRVPVEHRFLGLDKRSFPFAFVVIALWLGLHFGIPQLNNAVTPDDLTVAGDRILVTDTLAITPAAGWQVEQGLRTTDATATGEAEVIVLTKGGVQFVVQADDFDGTSAELVAQINRVAEASQSGTFNPVISRATVTTASGITGVSETVQGAAATGRIIAFTDDGKGIEFQAVGPTDQMVTLAPQINQMITSLSPIDAAGENS